MKKTNTIIAIAIMTMVGLFSVRCNRQNQNIIRGKIIAYEYCTSTHKGYLIEVQEPQGIGENIVLNKTQYSNVVKTYSKATTSLQIGDLITGIYQTKPDSICRVCTTQYPIYNVPEVIVTFQN